MESQFHQTNYPMLIDFVIRLFNISKMFFSYGIIFIFVLALIILDIDYRKKQLLSFTILGFIINYQNQNKLKLFTYLYVLAAFIGAYSMVLSPGFPTRAYFIVIVFSVISLYQIILQRNIIIPKFKMATFIVLSLLFISLASKPFYYATRGIIEVYIHWHNRIEYINSEIRKNNFDLEVPLIPTQNKYTALFGLPDVNENKNGWPNPAIAIFYGLNSISLNEIRPDEVSLRKNFKKIIFPAWLFKYPQ